MPSEGLGLHRVDLEPGEHRRRGIVRSLDDFFARHVVSSLDKRRCKLGVVRPA